MNQQWMNKSLWGKTPQNPDRLVTVMDNHTQQEVQQELGNWHLYQYTDQPRPTLKIMVNQQGRAAVTVTKNPDGTVTTTPRPKWIYEHLEIFRWTTSVIDHMKETVTARLHAKTSAHTGRPENRATVPQPYEWTVLTREAPKTAKTILQNNCGTATDRGVPVDVDINHATRAVNRVMREHIIDPELKKLTTSMYNFSPFTLERYNHVARNHQVFQKVHEDAPRVLYFLADHILHRSPYSNIRFRDPKHLTRTVREALGITGSDWTTLVRLGWPQTPYPNISDYQGPIRLGARALREANQPQGSRYLQINIFHKTARHTFYDQHQGWRHGNPWRAWIHLLVRALQASTEKGYTNQQLNNTEDALRWHIEHQQPWGPTTWANYVARSKNWHDEQWRQGQAQKDLGALEDSQWESLMPQTRFGDVTAKPVVTSQQLTDLAKEMKNCLGQYRQRCESGNTRIFVFLEDGKVTSAGEIMRTQGAWLPGQLEASTPSRRRRAPSRHVRIAFHKTIELYNQLEKEGEAQAQVLETTPA